MRPRDGGEGLDRVARARLASDPGLDLYVYGHTHADALARAGGGVYANPGAWMDAPRCLHVTDSRVEFVEIAPDSTLRVLRFEARVT